MPVTPYYWPSTPSAFMGNLPILTTPQLPNVPQQPKAPVFAPQGYASLSVPQALSKQMRMASLPKNINQSFQNPGFK